MLGNPAKLVTALIGMMPPRTKRAKHSSAVDIISGVILTCSSGTKWSLSRRIKAASAYSRMRPPSRPVTKAS